MAAGASGYLLKQVRGAALVSAVRTVAAGGTHFGVAPPDRAPARPRDPERDRRLASLTEQERTVLGLIGEGLTNRQIGERLFLAEKTVKNYVSALFAKLGMERRAQAAAYAARVFDEHGDTGHPPHHR